MRSLAVRLSLLVIAIGLFSLPPTLLNAQGGHVGAEEETGGGSVRHTAPFDLFYGNTLYDEDIDFDRLYDMCREGAFNKLDEMYQLLVDAGATDIQIHIQVSRYVDMTGIGMDRWDRLYIRGRYELKGYFSYSHPHAGLGSSLGSVLGVLIPM